MPDVLQQIRDEVAVFHNTPEGHAARLRHGLAHLILKHLELQSVSEADLARATGMTERTIGRLIHSQINWDAKTAGRILHALKAAEANA